MRFSAVQEDSFGVGLGQERVPDDADASMMAATGDLEPESVVAPEEGSMISNLPLLFANGYPTSLEKIKLPELERFINFMVQCSLGHDTVEVISEPLWWPKEVKFSNPIVRPKKVNDAWMGNLKKLVFRCYSYHRSDYLLRFCSYLAQYPHDKLEYVNNWDSTTSLYHKNTGKLLVTFRNENMNYDKKVDGTRRKLLNGPKAGFANGSKGQLRRSLQKKLAPSPAMVEPPSDDIYLCDDCDAEIVGDHKMKEHEKLCRRLKSRPETPEVQIAPEMKQDTFLGYFKLTTLNSIKEPSKEHTVDDAVVPSRSSGRIRGSVNLTRCPTIPFSSPAGILLAKKSKMMTETIQQERLDRIERHLAAPPLYNSIRPKWLNRVTEYDRWTVTYKPNRERLTKNCYIHDYHFDNNKKKPVLDLRSQLLYISCRPIYVSVDRLTDEQVKELLRDPSKYKKPERRFRPRLRLSPRRDSSPELSKLGDKCNPIIIDLEDDEPLQPVTTPILKPIAITPMVTLTPIVANQSTVKCVPNTAKRLKCSKPIIFVDLCSSDDEDVSSNACASTDENRDPLRKMTEVRVGPSFIRNLTPIKTCTKPCTLYPTDSTSEWLANLNLESDGRAGHRRNEAVLKSCTGFSKVLKEAP